MSCRSGHNSVVVSLAWFLTRDNDTKRADEGLVKKAFHDLRREHAQRIALAADVEYPLDPVTPMHRHAVLTERGAAPVTADPADVVDWLRGREATVRHDGRIKDRLRDEWCAKIEDAIADTLDGRGPDAATFAAWQDLEEEARRRKERAAAQQATRVTGDLTADERVNGAVDDFALHVNRAGWEALARREDAELSAAYARLLDADRAARNANSTSPLTDRLRRAQADRTQARQQAHETTGEAAEQARRKLQKANERAAFALAIHPDADDIRGAVGQATQSPSVWRQIQGSDLATRGEKWSALEYLSRQHDRHLVSSGRLDADGPQRRARRRLQFRQQLRESAR